jgi:hypothetical protein
VSPRVRAPLFVAGVVAICTTPALLPAAPLWLRAIAALGLSLLPGWLLATALLGRPPSAYGWFERLLYGLGAGYGITFLLMLGLAALPGGVPSGAILGALAAISLLIALWVDRLPPADHGPERPPRRTFWIALAAILLLGGILRVTNLGYSEFQGDEARVLLRAGEVLAGFPNALYVHQKPPGEILMVAALYGQAGAINEFWARLPFTLAGLGAVAAALLLGRRWAGLVGGVVAAALLAVDGYLTAFARIVQYQSIVILVSLLVLLLLDGARTDQRRLTGRLALAGFLAATGLLAHYDLLAVALPALYLLVELARSLRGGLRRLLPALMPGALLAVGLPALFFVPWLRYPGFGEAYRYVIEERLGLQFPYNNLFDFLQRTFVYSSAYAIIFMAIVTLAYMSALYHRRFGGWAGVAAAALVAGGLAVGLAQPAWLTVAGRDVTLLFTLPLLGVVLLGGLRTGVRAAWLWFAPLFIAALFLIGKPDSHVYVFFVPWALLTGLGVQTAVTAWQPRPAAAWAMGAAGVALALIFAGYPWLIFADAPVERLRTWDASRPRAYWYPFAQPPERAIMGFPLRNGWKVAGVLYAQGDLTGGFESNARPEVADWYTRAAAACPSDTQHFFLTTTVEPTDDAWLERVRQEVEQVHGLSGVVTVGGGERLRIYTQGAAGEAAVHPLEAYEAAFDALTAQPMPPRRGRVLVFADAPAVDARFGEAILLHSARITPGRVAAGEVISIELAWESIQPTIYSYTVFLHVVDPLTNTKVGQSDALPVCGQALTWQWNPGDKIIDPQRVEIDLNAPPGRYRLYAGLYRVETGERMAVVDESGAPVGDFVDLGEIVVTQ